MWNRVDFASFVNLSDRTGFDSFDVERKSDGSVMIVANYNSDIHNKEITVVLDPSKSGEDVLSRSPVVEKTFLAVPNNNEAALFYN